MLEHTERGGEAGEFQDTKRRAGYHGKLRNNHVSGFAPQLAQTPLSCPLRVTLPGSTHPSPTHPMSVQATA